jgi:aminoglycoside phosphotransferase family enzyme/predicted kinase
VSFSRLWEYLQREGFYPHPVTIPIQVIQTHISVIFLTGNYAYKLKKAVNFGFLDFSSLEKRKYFLEQEFRLNQPIAPDIYLQVLPLCQEGEDFYWGSHGEVVEYILKMNQFPQECLLTNLLAQGMLTPSHLTKLGQGVAKFHQHCSKSDYITNFGTVTQIREAIEDNYQRTQKYLGKAQTPEQYKNTKEFTDKFLQTRVNLFEQRQARGKIRECHGDLHLGNICYWRDKMQLFDRIEFNEPFRFVDTMCDVAFVVMDLDYQERRDLSNIFLNTYLETTGDWEGLQVLPLYLTRQAYVRAKVNSFLLDDAAIRDKEKIRALLSAQKYYHLAYQYTQPRQAQLYITSGISGSGKTTAAKKIAAETEGIYIRSDAVRKHLAGIPLDTPGSPEIYTSQMSQQTYTRLFQLGELLLQEGYTVILDAKFDQRQQRAQALDLARLYQVPYQIVYCSAPVDILELRLRQRHDDISDATVDLLEQQRASFEDFSEEEKSYLSLSR